MKEIKQPAPAGPDVKRAFRVFGLTEPDYDRAADVSRWFREGRAPEAKVPDWGALADAVDDWQRECYQAMTGAVRDLRNFVAAAEAFTAAVRVATGKLFRAYGDLLIASGMEHQIGDTDED